MREDQASQASATARLARFQRSHQVQALLQLPMDPDAVPSFPAGDDRVEEMLLCSLFEPEFSEPTALILAARMNHPEVVQLLLEAGAKANFANPYHGAHENASALLFRGGMAL